MVLAEIEEKDARNAPPPRQALFKSSRKYFMHLNLTKYFRDDLTLACGFKGLGVYSEGNTEIMASAMRKTHNLTHNPPFSHFIQPCFQYMNTSKL